MTIGIGNVSQKDFIGEMVYLVEHVSLSTNQSCHSPYIIGR